MAGKSQNRGERGPKFRRQAMGYSGIGVLTPYTYIPPCPDRFTPCRPGFPVPAQRSDGSRIYRFRFEYIGYGFGFGFTF